MKRIKTVWTSPNGRWVIAEYHIICAENGCHEGEYYPLIEIEDHNIPSRVETQDGERWNSQRTGHISHAPKYVQKKYAQIDKERRKTIINNMDHAKGPWLKAGGAEGEIRMLCAFCKDDLSPNELIGPFSIKGPGDQEVLLFSCNNCLKKVAEPESLYIEKMRQRKKRKEKKDA